MPLEVIWYELPDLPEPVLEFLEDIVVVLSPFVVVGGWEVWMGLSCVLMGWRRKKDKQTRRAEWKIR